MSSDAATRESELPIRIAIVGLGAVGQRVLEALRRRLVAEHRLTRR